MDAEDLSQARVLPCEQKQIADDTLEETRRPFASFALQDCEYS
jgi:hypothetical protein